MVWGGIAQIAFRPPKRKLATLVPATEATTIGVEIIQFNIFQQPPEPIQSADIKALKGATMGRTRPPFKATDSITSGTPCPLASGTKK